MMKCTLLVLMTSLACSSVIGAELKAPDVTIFGRLSTAFTKATGSDIGLYDGADTGYGGSRLGFKGSEKIAEGRYVDFMVETGFDTSEGGYTGGAEFGGRQTYIGIRDETWGMARFGRQYKLAHIHEDTYAPIGTDYGDAGAYILSGYIAGGVRQNNAYAYFSTEISGFSIYYLSATKEDSSDAASDDKGNYKTPYSGMLNYKIGKFSASYTFTKNNTDGTHTINQMGALYDFNYFKVMGTYEIDNNQKGGKDSYAFGFKVPVNSWMLKLQYGEDKNNGRISKSTGLSVPTRRQIAFATEYNFTDRFQAYGAISQLKPYAGTMQYTLGLGYNF
ncbi:TPA: porin [Klebsiella pneumoniae]|nr:porin [Klebsiella pneumoniae]HBR1478484.1 porin [Klebsiella pneumoniae]